MLEQEINEVIENRRKALKMSKYKLAKLMGITPSYLGKLLGNDDKHRWNIECLDKAFKELGIKIVYKTECKRRVI